MRRGCGCNIIFLAIIGGAYSLSTLIYSLIKSYNINFPLSDKIVNKNVVFAIILSIVASMIGATLALAYKYIRSEFNRIKRELFMSFSPKDSNVAIELCNELKDTAYKIIINSDIMDIGDDFNDDIVKNKIYEAINRANIFIIVISININKAGIAHDELTYAINNNKKIIPIIIDESNLPEQLSSLNSIYYRKGSHDNIDLLKKSIDDYFKE